MNISLRLQAVAKMLKIHKTVADVGCDHGYLSIYLVEKFLCEKVIAMDLRKDPLNKAISNITEFGFLDRISTRLSDGIKKLNKGEVQSICIAGMGGPLIIKILEEGKPWNLEVSELVLSPQSEIEKVREYLFENDCIIDEEDMIYEDGKFYNIFHVVFGKDVKPKPVERRYGRFLLENKNATLLIYLKLELKKLSCVYDKLLTLEKSESVISRIDIVQNDIALVKEALDYYDM